MRLPPLRARRVDLGLLIARLLHRAGADPIELDHLGLDPTSPPPPRPPPPRRLAIAPRHRLDLDALRRGEVVDAAD